MEPSFSPVIKILPSIEETKPFKCRVFVFVNVQIQPIGVWQLPPSFFKNARSAKAEVCVSLSSR